ncbi:copper homeostasis protein CutC [Oceanobacillus timonensis]|uniref:copper homeostasis protein CutC n=1 Tax=Oceanobacillus timonensis TaxID=1926285 RepID=UPI0015C4B134|nr:copper homeostasis protein CutC [Oceanobacillus timonensis]
MLIEVIGTSVNDVIDAENTGADRVELCAEMAEGGLTPSIGVVEAAVDAVDIPINVMVRPHGKSFVYSDVDIDVMLRDIRAIKQAGANGIVIGTLTENGVINEGQLHCLLNAEDRMEVTFHRAFDEVNDQFVALEVLLKYKKIKTILTSGGKDKATDAIERLADLVSYTKNSSLAIMPGSGLCPDKIDIFHKTVQSDALHFGAGVRVDGSFDQLFSEEKIAQIRELAG